MTLPNDEVMKQMSKLAIEMATESIARSALEFAEVLKSAPPLSGSEALVAFAKGIRTNNLKSYGNNDSLLLQ